MLRGMSGAIHWVQGRFRYFKRFQEPFWGFKGVSGGFRIVPEGFRGGPGDLGSRLEIFSGF